MNSFVESLLYYSVKAFGFLIRLLPARWALGVGRLLGLIVYYVDIKHRLIVLSNLRIAFAESKSLREVKQIAKAVFQNYAQNFIELLRFPAMNFSKFDEYIKVEGREHVQEALSQGKGLILLAMHFGSWELANLATSSMGRPYKIIVNPQKRFSRLDELLNSYRACGGAVTIERGMGTREFITSLRNNEIIGMVVDQGGKDGLLMPFLGRQASMASGAIRVGLKWDVPICFAIIVRENGPHHRLIIHKPLQLEKTNNSENDVQANLQKVVAVMEGYIRQYPDEYMWFYKIWKYAKESVITILEDGRTGHLRQSQTVAKILQDALREKGTSATIRTASVIYKSQSARRLFDLLSALVPADYFQGRLDFMKWFLTPESFSQLMSGKADFIISCGAATAAVNYFLATDQQAKSVVIQKPGILGVDKFNLVLLPRHDAVKMRRVVPQVVVTAGAPNRIDPEYLEEQSTALMKRFSHLKVRDRFIIGLFIGGDTKEEILDEQQIKNVIYRIKEITREIDAEILATTSRRTSVKIENILQRELKKYDRCGLLIVANRNNIPEAVGGILGLADLVVVSGDSISMISEAASSGRKTIVFSLRDGKPSSSKHNRFVTMLHQEGHILSSDAQNIKTAIYGAVKNKFQLRKIDDQPTILEGVRKIL